MIFLIVLFIDLSKIKSWPDTISELEKKFKEDPSFMQIYSMA